MMNAGGRAIYLDFLNKKLPFYMTVSHWQSFPHLQNLTIIRLVGDHPWQLSPGVSFVSLSLSTKFQVCSDHPRVGG